MARSCGVETSYVDLSGRTRHASPKALRAVLQALGSRPARRPLRRSAWRRFLQRRPLRRSAWRRFLQRRPLRRSAWRRFLQRRPEPVRVVWDKRPFGYHRVGKTLVISAPRRCFQGKERSWGLFLPLHALHSKRSPGAGDLTDLKAFARWAGRMGAGWVGTLPLLSQFLDKPRWTKEGVVQRGKPFEPSPYSPVSRLFWNEFWVDVGEIKSPRRSPGVDYRRQMEAKWRILEKKAKGWAPPRRWLRDHPDVEEYARFRAGKVSAKTILYGQWLVGRQMEQLRRACDRAGVGLYFDLPLGAHPSGYDAWKEGESFVRGMHVGAPPDPFFSGGQDWGFCPPHPERIRELGYDYFIRCVRHSMRHASMLRVDHIMGLHRLFWVPAGMPAREGVYVRYKAEELYAILSLESHRNRCAVVGEDLGTVPPEVRRSMRRHGLSGMFVVQYEWDPNSRRPLRAAPRRSVACLNTHDMPPFAAFWKKHKGNGGAGAVEAARALLKKLSAGPARAVQVNPEDLWGELRPHNVPGTRGPRNWRRKMRFPLERICRMGEITKPLQEINRLRARKAIRA